MKLGGQAKNKNNSKVAPCGHASIMLLVVFLVETINKVRTEENNTTSFVRQFVHARPAFKRWELSNLLKGHIIATSQTEPGDDLDDARISALIGLKKMV